MPQFSFELVPEGVLGKELQEIVNHYSAVYSSSPFLPHITLYGAINSNEADVLKAAQELAQQISPLKIELGLVEFSTTHFQCVFARVKTTAQLMKAHLLVKLALGVNQDHVFMPHISLVYGDFDMETREKMTQQIKLQTSSCRISSLTVVRSDSQDPKDWHIVAQIPLQSHK
jgi:2'-5' RNA ligase